MSLKDIFIQSQKVKREWNSCVLNKLKIQNFIMNSNAVSNFSWCMCKSIPHFNLQYWIPLLKSRLTKFILHKIRI